MLHNIAILNQVNINKAFNNLPTPLINLVLFKDAIKRIETMINKCQHKTYNPFTNLAFSF